MANKLYQEDSIRAIAEAIRQKGVSGQMTVGDMAGKVLEIPTGSADVPFRLGGLNAEKVAEYTESWTLADTSFVIGSSSSTSATCIKYLSTYRFQSPTVNFGDKDIVILQTVNTRPRYSTAATNKALTLGYVGFHYSIVSKIPTEDLGAKNTRGIYSITTPYYIKFYNTGGYIKRSNSQYGFYMTTSEPRISPDTGDSAKVTASSPALYYRCSNTYHSAANCKAATACDFNWRVEVYAVDPFTTAAAELTDRIEEILVTL